MYLNGRWRGFASATKRLATSMTDRGRADCARQLLETTACWSDCQKPGQCQPPHSSKRSGRQWRLFREELYVDSCSQWSPQSYCSPETRESEETMLCTPRPTAWQKVGQQKSGEKFIFQINRQLSSIPSIANIVDDPQGPVWTQGSPRRQSNLEGGKIMVRGYIQCGDTLIVPNINRFLPPSTFPITRGVRFFNRILAIPQVPLWSFSGGRRSRSFRDGQHSLQIWILLSISGEDWRRKHGGPSRRTWRSFGMKLLFW